jgi:predicted permease
MIFNEFYHHFLTVANQVLILFLLIALGFICGKKGIISEKAAESLSSLALYFSTPAAIICSFVRPFEKEKLTNLGYAFLISIIFHIFAISLSLLIKQKNEMLLKQQQELQQTNGLSMKLTNGFANIILLSILTFIFAILIGFVIFKFIN